ncbi:hypothetical protein J4220_00920 [Candidatus Micrarchaeota archaeon]|nr:hypothetical protein [Candidatus Micrarchaeota archaeon]
MKKLKGYIGPLGDDIPSIFPIVFAVLIFTGTIIYANQLISEKARQLEIREGAVSLSYLVTETGFTDAQTLGKTCKEKVGPRASSLSVKYLITLKRFCDGIPIDFKSTASELNPYSPETEKTSPFYIGASTRAGETWVSCSNDAGVPSDGIFEQPKDSVVMSFPVAVPCPEADSFTNGLGVVNVVAWK